jgi:hypothetical protein
LRVLDSGFRGFVALALLLLGGRGGVVVVLRLRGACLGAGCGRHFGDEFMCSK